MAQYVGFAPAPADVPGPRMTIAPIPTAPSVTTADIPSPIVTNRAPSGTHGDAKGSPSRTSQHLKTLSKKAVYLGHKYRWEIAPAGAIGTLNTLGWWLGTEPHSGLYALGAAGLAAGAGFVAAHGLKEKHDLLFGASVGATTALVDVAAATGFGFGPVSFTVAAITTALAYAAYVPWLVKHRREHGKASSRKHEAATDEAITATPPMSDRAPDELDGGVYLPETAPIAPLHNPFNDKVIPYTDDASDDIRQPLHIGYDEHGNPIHLVMLYRHTLITGATDWGKSGAVNLLIKKLLKKKHVEIYGIDLKPGAPELGPWEPRMKWLARTPEEARELLEYYLGEGDRRGKHLSHLSTESLARGGPAVKKWIPGDPSAPVGSPEWGHGTAKFLFIDELGELVRQDLLLRKAEQEERRLDPENAPPASPPVEARLESGLALLRFVAMHIESATQQASARVFGGNTDQRGNYNNRLSTRVNDEDHAQFLFGKNWKKNGYNPKLLNRPGEIFLGNSEMPDENPPRIRLMFVTDDDVAADVSHLHAAAINEPIGRFAPQGQLSLVKTPEAPKPARPEQPKVFFPDGSEVRRGSEGWLDLYKVFLQLCDEHGYATKEMLTEHGPYDSRDTVRRAVDHWLTRGVQVRKAGRTDQFYLPEAASEDN